VVTTTGVLTAALFGIATFVRPVKDHGIPVAAHGPLVLAMVLLLLSAACAIMTNVPRSYESVATEELKSAVTGLWGDNPNDAMQRVAATQVKEIKSARHRNKSKAWLLVASLELEIFGLVSLGWTVYEMVQHTT